MPKPEIEFQPTSLFPEDVTQDLSIRTLSADPNTGDKTVLLTHTAGSAWGSPVCKHDYWEEVYIIEGRIFDETLQQWFNAGSYCCRPPGMLHGPFRADENGGCKEICWLRYPRKDETISVVQWILASGSGNGYLRIQRKSPSFRLSNRVISRCEVNNVSINM